MDFTKSHCTSLPTAIILESARFILKTIHIKANLMVFLCVRAMTEIEEYGSVLEG